MRNVLFMGEILASVTHEMQNVMAIIKESGALADDILNLNGPPRMKYGDKLAEALRHVQEQVRRGRDLMIMLNGFAHAASDHPETSDIVRFAKQISVLAERMVHLAECTLMTELESPPLPVRGNALMLMQSLYLGLEAVLACCPAGDCITISVSPAGPEDAAKGIAAVAAISARKSRLRPDLAQISAVMEELRGSCRSGEGLLELCYASPQDKGA